MENAFLLMLVTKLVPTADSCDFITLLLMIAHDDEAVRGEKGKKRRRIHYFILKEGRPTTLDLAEAAWAKK